MMGAAFLPGLGCGLTLFVLRDYLLLSPRWFRRVVTLSGLGVTARYLVLASAETTAAPMSLGAGLLQGWAAVGLTLPCVAAADQLVRHPAMTPKKLLRLYAPWGLGLLGLSVAGPLGLAAGHSAFALATAWVAALLIRKLPGGMRLGLAGLATAQVMAAGRQAAAAFVPLTVPIWFAADLLVLASIWAALKTSRVSA